MRTKDAPPGFTPVVIERQAFEGAATAPDALRVTFRSIGHLPLTVALMALSFWGYLSDERRQAIHCRRDTATCVITSDGPLHHARAAIALKEIQRVQDVEVGDRRHPERAIELVADSGSLRLELTERCNPESACPETTRVSQQVRRFLEQPAQPALDVSYGPFGSLDAVVVFSLLIVLFGVVQVERVVVVVSSKLGRMLVLEHHLLGRRHYRALPLHSIATCTIDAHRGGRHGRRFVSLVGVTGETYQLTRSGPLQEWLRRLFVRRVNAALNAARD